MTVSVLKQDPNTQKVKTDAIFIRIQTHKRFRKTLIYFDTDTQSANFRGNPLCQATKQQLKTI